MQFRFHDILRIQKEYLRFAKGGVALRWDCLFEFRGGDFKH
jgi:hypothetical protein